MTERDYILCTNVARLYTINGLLRDLMLGEITHEDRAQVLQMVDKWLTRTQKAIHARRDETEAQTP